MKGEESMTKMTYQRPSVFDGAWSREPLDWWPRDPSCLCAGGQQL